MSDIRDFFRRQKAALRPAALSTDGGDMFALALYGVLRQKPGNLSFSPFGIRMGLALAHVGARGDTAAQMASVLGLGAAGVGDPVPPFTVLARFDDAERSGLLRVANALWIQEGVPVAPAFPDEVAERFRGESHSADFAADWERARIAINQWVAKRTMDAIPEVLERGPIGIARHVDIIGDHAYSVIPATYTFKKDGKPMSEAGATFIVALQKEASGWKITAGPGASTKQPPLPGDIVNAATVQRIVQPDR